MATAKKTPGRPRSEAQKATEKNIFPETIRSTEEARRKGQFTHKP